MTIESKLDLMQNQLNNVIELLQIAITTINTKKSVSKFLNKSEKTIDNYIKNQTFVLNKHYFINENEKIEFIPSAILEFKKNPNHKIKIIEVKKEEKIILSETSSKILKGLL
jgi:Holliday junction resolvase RusA-like endonuclease